MVSRLDWCDPGVGDDTCWILDWCYYSNWDTDNDEGDEDEEDHEDDEENVEDASTVVFTKRWRWSNYLLTKVI